MRRRVRDEVGVRSATNTSNISMIRIHVPGIGINICTHVDKHLLIAFAMDNDIYHYEDNTPGIYSGPSLFEQNPGKEFVGGGG